MQNEHDPILSTISHLLIEVRDARPGAMDDLFKRVYPDLRRLANHILDRRARGHRAVSATTLVHSACARLMKPDALHVQDRRHFFRLFCRAMENEWIDRVRRSLAFKRGGNLQKEALIDLPCECSSDAAEFLDLRAALAELNKVDADAAEVANLRYYCNATLEETAEIMGCSFATVRRNWSYAKSWLHERLTRECPQGKYPPSDDQAPPC